MSAAETLPPPSLDRVVRDGAKAMHGPEWTPAHDAYVARWTPALKREAGIGYQPEPRK